LRNRGALLNALDFRREPKISSGVNPNAATVSRTLSSVARASARRASFYVLQFRGHANIDAEIGNTHIGYRGQTLRAARLTREEAYSGAAMTTLVTLGCNARRAV
jgi:hypothetical protein